MGNHISDHELDKIKSKECMLNNLFNKINFIFSEYK